MMYPSPAHLLIPPYPPLQQHDPPTNQLKTKTQTYLLPHLSNTSPFILVASGAVVCHTVYHLSSSPTRMAPGGGHPEPWTSIQTLAMVGPWMQTWPLAAVLTQMGCL